MADLIPVAAQNESEEAVKARKPLGQELALISLIPYLDMKDLRAAVNAEPHPITEHFFSFQGEGASNGRPVYFVRYSRCNFRCEWCDSKRTWDNADTMTGDQLIEVVDSSMKGSPNDVYGIVITGGEPTLYANKHWFVAFLAYLKSYMGMHIEIETDGALFPKNTVIFDYVDQWNVSPKIGSSGIEMTETYKKNLASYANLAQNGQRVYFKFVVRPHTSDIDEIKALVDELEIPSECIWLMAEGETITKQLTNMPAVAQLCLDNRYNFSTRSHILVWNDKPGV